ncbi:MAG TPA: hypothetical protein VNG90_01990 [Candidatus Acidoferrum sp.]|nr:hypothetical protein [Candidatus Acidoferrum sp.]
MWVYYDFESHGFADISGFHAVLRDRKPEPWDSTPSNYQTMATLTATTLGTRAKGTFGPQPGVSIAPIILEVLEGMQFVRSSTQKIIGSCGDERLDESDGRLLLPPVFGGWFSAVLADALSTRLWYRPGMTAEEHALSMTDAVRGMHPSVLLCVHTDTHSLHNPECGCAAIAKAPAVLRLLLENADLIAPKFREHLVDAFQALLGSGYFQPGTTALVDALEQDGVKKEILAGDHTGVAVLRNNDTGKVYDRPAFYAWCEQNNLEPFTFFEYSRWAMYETAKQLTPSTESAELFFAAADAFNNAVPLAICTPATFILDRYWAE